MAETARRFSRRSTQRPNFREKPTRSQLTQVAVRHRAPGEPAVPVPADPAPPSLTRADVSVAARRASAAGI
jgi:hypothetical protein